MQNKPISRLLKVYSLSILHAWKNTINRPQIRLQGKWLKQAGFNPGDKIAVFAVNGSIHIKKVDHDR
jgi:hypothetical protein